eukprot:TRINITY_DN727_c1_g1_i1.p1 TRINITY_DN727_c1_g1~~TRINITY_DN727_c1_g1_i1.p1  ORF type:complete len:277 (-),score=65.05 TRINITY_DN727_c1_g1_i1:840-1670(-)
MSLKDNAYDRFLNEVLNKVNPKNGFKGMIVDKYTAGMISSFMDMDSLLEHDVMVTEYIKVRRQPLVDWDMIYFVQPTEENAMIIVDDFKKDNWAEGSIYKSAHVYFTSHASDAVIDIMTSCQDLVDNLAALVETNFEFYVLDENAFTLNQSDALSQLFSSKTSGPEVAKLKGMIIEQLMSVCISLEENPYIRYRLPKSDGDSVIESMCKSIAFGLYDELTKFYKASGRDRRTRRRGEGRREGNGREGVLMGLFLFLSIRHHTEITSCDIGVGGSNI